MDEMLEWLRGVLDDDERVAKAATPGHWGAQPGPAQYVLNDEWEVVTDAHELSELGHAIVFTGLSGGGVVGEHNAVHIARHDPAAVLADVAAKRKLLSALEEMATDEYNPWAWNHIAILASAYRRRPGWKHEWET